MKILIDLDEGYLARIERERQVIENAGATVAADGATIPGKRPARTGMIRVLLGEALDKRCLDRGEEIPSAPEPTVLPET